MLSLPIELQCLSVLTSSVERWGSFFPKSRDLPADLLCRYFSLSCARRLKYLRIYDGNIEVPRDIIALIETTTNPQFLPIGYRLDRHCAYSPLIDSLLNNLSCERTWNMLQHFGGTALYLNRKRDLPFYPSRSITFSNLKILSLNVPEWNDLFRLLPLLYVSTLQILDLDITRSYSDNPEWLIDRLLLKMRLPLLALRIFSFECADGLDCFRIFKQFLWWKS